MGNWDDIIKLSKKEIVFESHADSVIITTKGSCWWIADISIDGVEFFDFRGIDLEADSYSITHECVMFEKQDPNTIFIKVDANPLNKDRLIIIGLEAGDYFDRIRITQNKH